MAELDRRRFIELTSVATLSYLLRTFSLELEHPETIEKLLEQIKKIDRPYGFPMGIHTDEIDDWKAFRDNIEYGKFWGRSTNFEQYLNPNYRVDEIIYEMHSHGAIPMISFSTDWPYNNLHCFHPSNRQLIYELIDRTCENLSVHPYLLGVRALIEPNLPSFAHGRGPRPGNDGRIEGLSNKMHEEGFKDVFRYFYKKIKATRLFPTLFCFSPWVDTGPYWRFPFEGYFPGREFMDWAGFDGYNFIAMGLAKFLNLDYLLYGNQSPQKVFGDPFNKMWQLGEGKVPLWVFEAGTRKYDDSEWLELALLTAMADPRVAGFMHFGVDRTKEEGINFRLGPETLEVYSKWSKLY